MADIAQSYKMSTVPVITHTVSYDTQRIDQTVYVRFKIVTAPLTSSYFGYSLNADITLAGKTVETAAKLKSPMPNKWDTNIIHYYPSATEWYSVATPPSETTITAAINFYSTDTYGLVNTGVKTISTIETPKVILSNGTIGSSTTAFRMGILGDTTDVSNSSYTYYYTTDNSTWTTIYTGKDTSIVITPSTYGCITGSVLHLKAKISNEKGSAVSPIITYTCIAIPDVPIGLTATPAINVTDPITLTWQTVTDAVKYGIRVRYTDVTGIVSSWIHFKNVTDNTVQTIPSTYTAWVVSQGGQLDYSVCATNVYDMSSDWSNLVTVVYTQSTAVPKIKVNGTWKNAKQTLIKVNGVWKTAKKILIKVNGIWKEAKQ